MAGFRRLCRFLHREFGFFAVGLTVVYAISGLAVNHAHHWDPNYERTAEIWHMEPVGLGPTDEVSAQVLERLALEEEVKNTFRSGRRSLTVFVSSGELIVDLLDGEVLRRGFARRPLLYELNFMHLNTGKGAWTVIADVYAVLLLVLALTGIFLVKGGRGLVGRGGVWMALGIVLPIAYAALSI